MPEGTEEYRTIELSFNSEEINKYEDESNESDDSSGSDKDDKERKIGTMATKVHLKIIKVKMMRIKKIILRKE